MDDHEEMRISYLGGFSILFIEAIFWILAGILGNLISVKIGIFVIIIGGTFFYPLGLLAQYLLKRPKIREDNSLKLLFTQIGLMIPFSFPLIFMITKENVNFFFPALTIIVGIHYIPFVYAYSMKLYWILAILLILGGTYFGFMNPDNFHFCALYTGIILFLFAFFFRYLVAKEIKKESVFK